jgi:antitoxin component YwqK of YwqJK toxin-antitoxin module
MGYSGGGYRKAKRVGINKSKKMKIKLNISFVLMILSLLLFNHKLYAQKVITKKHYGTNITKEQYQVNAQGQRNGYYKSYNPDGVLLYSYYFKNGLEHGMCIDYAGQRNYSNVYCYGKPLHERIMDNGKIKSEKYYGCANNTNYLIYTKKLLSSDIYERVEYFPNGKIKEKFNETSSYAKSKGSYEKYHENGKLAEKGNIDNGRIGNWIGYFENGDTLYFAKYDLGQEVLVKTYFEGNKIESIVSIDEQFENISQIQYNSNGTLKSVQNSKTYPFRFECGSVDDPNTPKNWRQLAERRINCAGKSYNPLDRENNYVADEKTYDENGKLLSEVNFILRELNGKYMTYKKNEIELEEVLWGNVQNNKNTESFTAYLDSSILFLYKLEFKNIIESTYNVLKSEIDLKMKSCEDNKCLPFAKLSMAKNEIQNGWKPSSYDFNPTHAIIGTRRLEEMNIVLDFLLDEKNNIDKETGKMLKTATSVAQIKAILGL